MHLNRSKPMYRYPDRRRHVRILTLKNFGWAVLVCVVVFAVIEIRSEFTNSDPKPGEYGRLYDRQVTPVQDQAPPEVVREDSDSAIDDQIAADPMLVQPAARGQWLGTDAEPAPAPAPVARPVEADAARSGRLVIVGDSAGVSVVKQDRARPQLSGGFGRRQ